MIRITHVSFHYISSSCLAANVWQLSMNPNIFPASPPCVFAEIDSDGLLDWGTLGNRVSWQDRELCLCGLRAGQKPTAHPLSDRSLHNTNSWLLWTVQEESERLQCRAFNKRCILFQKETVKKKIKSAHCHNKAFSLGGWGFQTATSILRRISLPRAWG